LQRRLAQGGDRKSMPYQLMAKAAGDNAIVAAWQFAAASRVSRNVSRIALIGGTRRMARAQCCGAFVRIVAGKRRHRASMRRATSRGWAWR